MRAIAGRNIVVQVIHVTWDKSGRGGRAAEQRNQIPLALPLPDQLAPDIGRHLLVHESHWDRSNEISSAIRAIDVKDGFRFRCVSVRATNEGAALDWTWKEWAGIPPRRVRNDFGDTVPASHRVDLSDNEWARARWNARFTSVDTGTWWYESVIANVGVIPDAEIPIDFFTRSDPVDDYSQLAHLR